MPLPPAAAQSDKGKPSADLPFCFWAGGSGAANKIEGERKVRTTKNHHNGQEQYPIGMPFSASKKRNHGSTFLTFYKCFRKWSSYKNYYSYSIPLTPTAAQPNKENLLFCYRE